MDTQPVETKNPNATDKTLPYSDWCFVCGEDNTHGLKVKFKHNDKKEVYVDFTPSRVYNGYPDMTHGGVVSALLDETMGWATVFDTKRFSYTVDLHIRFRQPVPIGMPIRVIARPTRVTSRICEAEGEVLDSEGKILVSGKGRYMLCSKEETRRIDGMLLYDEETARLLDAE